MFSTLRDHIKMGVSFASIEDGASGGGTVKIGGDVGADLQPQNHSSSFLFFSFLRCFWHIITHALKEDLPGLLSWMLVTSISRHTGPNSGHSSSL